MKMVKPEIIGIVAVLIIAILSSGCSSDTTEKKVGIYQLSDVDKYGAAGNKKLIVALPTHTESVRVEYNLVGDEIENSATFGVYPYEVDPDNVEDPFSFFDQQYIEASPGKTYKGTKKFGGGKTFYYIGNFLAGNFTVYANVYE